MRTVAVILEARIDGFKKKMHEAGDAASNVGKGVKGAAKAAESEFEKLQDVALKNEQAWRDVSNTFAVVGAAAAAAAGLAVREFARFDQAMSGVASTGDDAAGSIDQLRDASLKMGADTAFSAVEAANGVEELARAGVAAADILGGGLAGSLDLAAAGQIGVADAAGIAATAMTQFKLSGEEIPHLADLLAAGAGKAMGGVDELGQALGQSGLVASQFGLDIEETVGGLSAFAAAGLLGSDAGTSFKNMLLKLAKPSKESQTAMDDLGIAAYDAQGNFVGLEGLAGQLQDKLGGLTDKQRQSTLATIFGTDAIRAASVLYENGSEGIADWTEAVNDSGYAAETAAKLQDNLVGDLEQLGGAWSTLAIQMGEVGDGPLRGAVQALEALVNIAGETPGAAQGIMAGVVAIAALAGGAALLMKGISGYAQYQTAMGTIAGSSPGIARAAGVVGKLGKAAGIAAVAFVAMQAAGLVLDRFASHATSLEDTATALQMVASGAEEIGSLDALFRDADDPTKQLAGGVDSLATGFSQLADVSGSWSTGAIYSTESFVAAAFGMEGQMDRVRSQFEALDQALSGMEFGDATAQFAQLREEMDPDGINLDLLLTQFDDYASKVEAASAAAGLGKLSQQELADLMSGEMVQGFQVAADGTVGFVDATEDAAAAAEVTAEAVQAEADAMQGVLDAASAAADAIQSLNDSQREAAGLFMGAEASLDNYVATLQGIKDGLEEGGTSLDAYSEKGRANRAALRDLATAGRDWTDAMVANGEGIEAANAQMGGQRQNLIDLLDGFGVTGTAADEYADRLGLIPNYVETLIAVEGAKLSAEEAATLNTALEGLPDDVKTQIITIAQLQGAEQAMAALADVDAVKTEPVIAPTYDPAGENKARSGVNSVEDNNSIVIGSLYNPAGENEARSGVNSVEDNTSIVIGSRYDGSGAASARADINSVQGKTVTITIRKSVIGGGRGLDSGFAGGGLIRGPGTGTSDDIPIMASNKEFMLREWAASKIGLDRLNYMNATGRIPHYSTGGQITPTGAPTAGAYTTGTAQAGGSVVTNHTYISVEGREAHALLADKIRYADQNSYRRDGVHRPNIETAGRTI